MNCPPKRYFHVQGIDEQTGSVFWLPRFLGELHPPAGLLSDEDLLHFVSSLEFQHRVCFWDCLRERLMMTHWLLG